jgi:hypothetical protein
MPVADALDAVEDVEGLAAAVLGVELELLLPHPATASAIPTAAAILPGRNFALIELVMTLLLAWRFTGPPIRPVTNIDAWGGPTLPSAATGLAQSSSRL